ncbi:hypothetical protein, variant 1 [Aphanomyces astaci]|uniref:DNA alkylation repair protein n=1 Tax=Aphanomyces astaci TaxID=112090 RepID=W4FEN7_APHAT|nr:hypothetical protein, variant 1 [Aphanomyces astaci]ETV65286.1 hypothetical protein, variant 1 [Aphanomyces astaci]|eukprot:XP_009845212.1 hypothetical protein, variant 1 [Aphanomyces astaci]
MRLTGFIALTEAFLRPTTTSWWSDTEDVVPVDDHIKQLGRYTRLSLVHFDIWVSSYLIDYSADDLRRHAIAKIYLANTSHCNNWDLVDASAHKILGEHLIRFHVADLASFVLAGPTAEAIDLLPAWYQRLLRSNDLWETRISIVLLLKLLPTEHYHVAYAVCLYHINKFHADPLLRCTIRGVPFESLDLIHKALGWVLREAGKHDPARLTQFLHEHASKAFKTTVRYATEHMTRPKAKRFLDVAQRGVGGSVVVVAPLLEE